jgi:hypothetical protein
MTENLRILKPSMTAVPVSQPLSIRLPRAEWDARAAAHRARVAPMAEAWLERRSRGEKHPVWDFLFTYYNFSPNKLMTWHPVIGEISNFKSQATKEDDMDFVWPEITPRLVRQAQWIATLCENVLNKPPRLGCFGLHEWAMVYRLSEDEIRHNGYQLRMSPEALADFVKAQPICCSHYDAYRFFTPEALPLNSLKPVLETRQDMEQSGCLHANMDLYKWAYKLWPWIGSDLLADAFEVAVASRAFDMRASPYELTALGFEPILIETDAGKEEYRREQQRLAAMALPVRRKLMEAAIMMASHEG